MPSTLVRQPTSRPWIVSRNGILAAVCLAAATLFVFRLSPDIDLAVARAFFGGGHHFIGQTPGGERLRHLFYAVPFAIVALLVGLYAARRLSLGRFWAPNGRELLFVLVSLALGPGLLVNVILKDHSHRPRPVQTTIFGGDLPFRPVGSFDGACARNCSFVSGEGSSAFWTIAPALLVPLSFQPLALAGALGFGVAVSCLRIAFGGHYLSDTIMAAALTWLVVAGSWRALMNR